MTPTTTHADDGGSAPATTEPIESWPQWRDHETAELRQEHGCTVTEARQAAERHRCHYDAHVVEAFSAGRDLSPRTIRELPAYLLHRMTGTPRWQNRELNLHPDQNPLRRYMDRLYVLNTSRTGTC